MILCACELYRVNEVQEKEPMPLESVLCYVRENAGSHFDPHWAGVLLRCEGKLKNLYESEEKA